MLGLLQHAVADEPPLAADPAGERDALSRLRANGDLEGHLRAVAAGARHDADRERGANGDHKRLVRLDALDLDVLDDADHAVEHVRLDGHLQQHRRQRARFPDDAAHQRVGLRERRVESRADRDQASGPHVLARGPAAVQARDLAREVLPRGLAGDGDLAARADLDLLAHLQLPLHEGAAEDAARDLLHRDARLVHVERARDEHPRRLLVIERRGRDRLLDLRDERVDVHVVVRAERDDGGALRDRALDERLDLVVGLARLRVVHDVNLVLHDDDLLDADDVERGQVLLRLRLGAGLVGGDDEERPVHDRRAGEHGRHERLVARGVDERDRAQELRLPAAVLARLGRAVRLRRLARRASVERGVRVPEADRDAAADLLGVAVRLLPGEAVHERRLPVVDVADDADVHRRLHGDLHRLSDFSCQASSIDFGPRLVIRRFTCWMSGEIAPPRRDLRFRMPPRVGWKPTPPLTSTPRRRGPVRSPRIGKPALSLPPVIFSLYPGSWTNRPSTSSPTFFPRREFARWPEIARWYDLPDFGSLMTALNSTMESRWTRSDARGAYKGSAGPRRAQTSAGPCVPPQEGADDEERYAREEQGGRDVSAHVSRRPSDAPNCCRDHT